MLRNPKSKRIGFDILNLEIKQHFEPAELLEKAAHCAGKASHQWDSKKAGPLVVPVVKILFLAGLGFVVDVAEQLIDGNRIKQGHCRGHMLVHLLVTRKIRCATMIRSPLLTLRPPIRTSMVFGLRLWRALALSSTSSGTSVSIIAVRSLPGVLREKW